MAKRNGADKRMATRRGPGRAWLGGEAENSAVCVRSRRARCSFPCVICAATVAEQQSIIKQTVTSGR